MLPLEIRFVDDTVRLTASAVPYGIAMVQPLEFGFIVGEGDDLMVLTPEEFACHDASCRPPTSGGTGGSVSKSGSKTSGSGPYAPKGDYVGKDADQRDKDAVEGRHVSGSGTGGLMTEPWLAEDGTITFTAKQNESHDKKLAKIGTSEAEWTANLEAVATKAMSEDAERTLHDSTWYSREHDGWGVPLGKEHNLPVETIMGIAACVSTNKQWDGVKSCNKEVVEKILKMLKDDISVTITAEDAAAYGQFSIDKPGTGGKYGPRTIEPGTYKLSEMSSGTLARVLGSGYQIGGQYYSDGLYKAFAVARGEIKPSDAIGSMKQRSFTNNLARPDVNYSSTNDFWMARAMLGSGPVTLPQKKGVDNYRTDMTVREWEKAGHGQVNMIFGSDGGAKGGTELFGVATRSAQTALRNLQAKDSRWEGMKLHEFQAVVWVQMQREYGNI